MNEPTEQSDEPSAKMKAVNKIGFFRILIIAAFPLVFAVSLIGETMRTRGPDLGFENMTGVKLPAHVVATAHDARFIFGARRTHFWKLDGNREEFRKLAMGLGLQRADEVVKRSVDPSMFAGQEPPRMYEGYGGYVDDRNVWLFVLSPGDSAVLQF